ncbi:GNAT family N-acetyltransferase [Candidatus Arsenophonus triatominarum]|uniref:GNAT family N-acetyltransferase n=1 Tax=Candidatus Arsenophonus triatominarum TaxID=57911 RepID=UPI001650BC3E|nr:GNAT family N-acetyltransferase [Candidatus Arsenophonus triatominarum]
MSVNEHNCITGFMATKENRLEMLFISPISRGKGIDKALLQYAVTNFAVNEVDVNEQTRVSQSPKKKYKVQNKKKLRCSYFVRLSMH